MEQRKRSRRRRNRIVDNFFPQKGDTKGEILRKVIFVLSVLILIFSLSYIIFYFYQSFANRQQISGLQDMLHQSEAGSGQVSEDLPEEYLPKFSQLYEANQDIAAWLKIDDTIVDYPVMQAEDNDKYLRHDFYLNYNEHGVPFLDFRVDLGKSGINYIVYGHNMRDGQMFGVLPSYRDLSFYQEHPVIQFDTIYEEAQWKIFGVFVTNTLEEHGEVFQYHNFVTPRSDEEFTWFVEEVKKRSFIDTGVDVQPGDTLLTLSTCTYEFTDARFVVVARKVREGENPQVDTSQAKAVSNPLLPDIWYKLFGGSAPEGVTSSPNPAGAFGTAASAPDISNPELEDEDTKAKEEEVLHEEEESQEASSDAVTDGETSTSGTSSSGTSSSGSTWGSGTSSSGTSSSGSTWGSGTSSSGTSSSGSTWGSGTSSSGTSSSGTSSSGSTWGSGTSSSGTSSSGSTWGSGTSSSGTSSSGSTWGSGTSSSGTSSSGTSSSGTTSSGSAGSSSQEEDYVDFDQLEEEEYPQDDDLLLDDEYEDIPDDSGEYDDSDDWDNDFIPDEFKDGIMSSKLKDTLSAVAGMLLQPKGAVAGWAPVSAAGGLKLNTSLVEKKESSGKLVLAGTGSLSSSASSTSSSGKLVLSGVGKLSTTTSSSSSALNKGEKITVYNTRTGEKVTDTYYNILAGMVQNEVGDDKGTTGMELEMVKAQTVATACILTRGLAQAEKNGTVYQTAMKTPGSVTNQAVSQVGDLVMTAGGSVIDATYFAISSGYTNDSEDVWANKVSYLRSVESPYDQEVEGYEASVLVDEEDLAQAVEENLGITLEGNPLKWLAVKSRNQGNYVQLMSVGGQTWYRDEDGERQDITGYAFRSLVFDNQLRSTAFKMGYSSANGTFRFTTYGYGHGVGMSQVGANEMAKRGYTYDEILHHYYTGVSIVSR